MDKYTFQLLGEGFWYALFQHTYLTISNISHTEIIFHTFENETSISFSVINKYDNILSHTIDITHFHYFQLMGIKSTVCTRLERHFT